MSLYVHRSIEYVVLSEMNIIIEYLECVFIEVNTRTKTQNKKVIVVIVYRPPSTNITPFTEHVMNTIDYLMVEYKQCYIMGDFNIKLINYGSHTETQDYTDAMFQHSFMPFINKPTRITTTTATVIYHIYITMIYLVQIVSHMELFIHIFPTTYQYLYILNTLMTRRWTQ